MNNPDVLLQVCVRMDEATLKLVSQTALWHDVKPIVSSSYYWYLRTQHEFDIELTNRQADWKDIYYKVGSYWAAMQPVLAAINNLESEMVVSVLLELGYNPNSGPTVQRAIHKNNYGGLRALLADERTVLPPASELLKWISQYSSSLNISELLLNDERFILDQDQRLALAVHLSYYPTSLQVAIEGGLKQVAILLLRYGRIGTEEYLLRDIVKMGDMDVLLVFLSKVRISRLADALAGSLGQSTVEVANFILSYNPSSKLLSNDAFVARTLYNAVAVDNLEIVRLLAPYSTTLEPSLALAIVKTDSSATAQRLEIVDILLLSPVIDLEAIDLTANFLLAIEPLIADRLVAAYRAWNYKMKTRLYNTFLKTLILSRLSPLQAMDWLIAKRDLTVEHTASYVLSGEISLRTSSIEAFYGYFYFLYCNMLSVGEMEAEMKRVECSLEGIILAKQLVGAQVGIGQATYTRAEYQRAMQVIL